MSLLMLIHGKTENNTLVFSDTGKRAKDKRLIRRIELPLGADLESFAREHWPSKKEIPKGYLVAVQRAYDYRTTGKNGKVEVPMLYYIAAKR